MVTSPASAAVTDDAVAVIEEVVADKGYHSRTAVHDLETLDIRTCGFLAHATIVPVTGKSYRLRQLASTTDD